MSYREAVEFLYGLRLFGTKLGLENAFALAALCGNPQDQLRFIHVAGTNGKGSTCAMLESICREAGFKSGLFTSPHLVSFTERIQVDRAPVSEADVARLTGDLIQRMGGHDPEAWPLRPTFFEFITIMALNYFAEQDCDLVIWETGMGGRLDATNIVRPLVSVITNVQQDHERWLGNSVSEIASEKAGIIKPGVPVVTAANSPEVVDVIAAKARHEGARLVLVRDSHSVRDIPLPLLGEHQRLNAATAVAAIKELRGAGFDVPNQTIRTGLEKVRWAGRLQLVRHGDTELLLDGAHNPDGARALASALRQHFEGRQFTLVLGLFQDKAWEEMCRELCPLARRVFLVPLQSERTADPALIQDFCVRNWPDLEARIFENVARALDHSLDRFVVVAGSLHLIGEAMEHLDVAPGGKSERELNEWNAANLPEKSSR